MKAKLFDIDRIRRVFSSGFSNRFDAMLAVTGRYAMQILEDAPVDLVVLDIRLENQEQNGLEVLNEILRRKRSQKVILNTAYPSYMDEGAAWQANGFVVKSADLTELKTTIKDILKT